MTLFTNEPHLDLRLRSERARLSVALADLDESLPIAVPLLVKGKPGGTPSLVSRDPGNPQEVVAQAAVAELGQINHAVALAESAARRWSTTPATERAAILARSAGELRRRRYELAALEVRECAKPWMEADADVAEAIDFLEYYGRHAVALALSDDLVQLPGERNTVEYRPRGVAAVIAPWNFPIAIVTGMVAGALATGNAVCLKPAEQSPACALAVVEALLRGGVPPDVIALLPGPGDVGAALVAHPGIHTVAFTGSAEVGLEILRQASIPSPGQRHLKRVIAEMGGKNCVIVDADADLDEVIPAVAGSAFGFAGQKCSAASRVMVHERIMEPFLERMCGTLPTLLVGQAEAFGTDVPPVIEADARDRIERAVAEAAAGGAQIARTPDCPNGDGFFVTPALAWGAAPAAAVSATELFGPVLACESVPSVEAACDLIDEQPQALTGGVFARNPRTIAEVVRRTPVGNFYVNRGITGAMVGRQPFGGNRMSGTGAKAGGARYLMEFVDPLVVTENTTRHGVTL